MTYAVEIKQSAFKVLKHIPRADQIKIIKIIKNLAHDPWPPNCLKLADHSCYRVRCGHYRIIYDIEDSKLIVIILKVGHRKEVYE